MKTLAVLLFCLCTFIVSSGYSNYQPSVNDFNKNLFNRYQGSSKQDQTNFANGLNNINYLNQGVNNKVFHVKQANNLQRVNQASRNKNMVNEFMNNNKSGKNRDNIDMQKNNIGFNKDKQNQIDRSHHKSISKSQNNVNSNSDNTLYSNNISKRSGNTDNGNSFANHADYGNSVNKDQSKYGGGMHYGTSVDGQKHRFGNQYNSAAQNSLDAAKLKKRSRQNYKKRQNSFNFDNSGNDIINNLDNLNFNQNFENLKQRKGNQFNDNNTVSKQTFSSSASSNQGTTKASNSDIYGKTDQNHNQAFKKYNKLSTGGDNYAISSYDHKKVGNKSKHQKGN